MWRVEFSESLSKLIKKFNAKQKQRIYKVIEADLLADPLFGMHIKKLRGDLEGQYRYRIGDIRLVYHVDISAKIVCVDGIDFRGSIY